MYKGKSKGSNEQHILFILKLTEMTELKDRTCLNRFIGQVIMSVIIGVVVVFVSVKHLFVT